MTTPEIQTAAPGTVKAWFKPLVDSRGRELSTGPWSVEPSKMQWVDAATQLPCLIVRSGLGALCGYAGVYPGHPWYRKHDYDSIPVDVHGGLTFAAACAHSADESDGVCHIPEPGTSDDVWWFGFDCAHCYDLVPGMMQIRGLLGRSESYRDVAYVAGEATSLAAQLKAAAENLAAERAARAAAKDQEAANGVR